MCTFVSLTNQQKAHYSENRGVLRDCFESEIFCPTSFYRTQGLEQEQIKTNEDLLRLYLYLIGMRLCLFLNFVLIFAISWVRMPKFFSN